MKTWMLIWLLLFSLLVSFQTQGAEQTETDLAVDAFAELDIDSDNRVQVSDIYTISPAYAVGSLLIKKNRFSRGLSLCSAVLIAEQYLMTAAHCVFDHLGVTAAMSVEFIPQNLGDNRRHPSRLFIEQGWLHNQYITEDYKDVLQFPNAIVSIKRKSHSSDLAILKVVDLNKQQGAGTLYGYVQPISSSQVFKQNKREVSVLSYPSDKPNTTLWQQTCQLHYSRLLIGKFDCRVAAGSSGAGVFVLDPSTKQHQLAGIVSSGSENGRIGQVVLLSDAVIADIQHMINQRPETVTQFSLMTFTTQKKLYLHVQNGCKQDIIAQAYHQPAESEHWGVISHHIAENHSAQFNALNSRKWYSHIRGLDDRPYNLGTDISLEIKGKRYAFKQRNIPNYNKTGKPFYGDHYLKVHCI